MNQSPEKGITLATNPATVLIAYHANCIDGFTSAWVAANAMKAQGKIFTMLPMEYTDESYTRLAVMLTNTTDITELYVVDFSLPLDTLEYLEEESCLSNLVTTILDHHKTAFERYDPMNPVTPTSTYVGHSYGASIFLDNDKSGADIVWRYFNNPDLKTAPAIIELTADYDLWRYVYGDRTRYVNSYLNSLPKTLAEWDRVAHKLDTNPQLIYDAGKIIYDAFIDKCKEYAEEATPCTLAGKAGLAVQCSGKYASQVGDILAVHSGTYGATYDLAKTTETDLVKWSIRSKDDYDVSEIAKQYYGGGHKNAAGFTLSAEATAIAHASLDLTPADAPTPTPKDSIMVHDMFSEERIEFNRTVQYNDELCGYLVQLGATTEAEIIGAVAGYLNCDLEGAFTPDDMAELYVMFTAKLNAMHKEETEGLFTKAHKADDVLEGEV